MKEVTRVSNGLCEGEGASAEALLTLVYEELRKLARHRMASEPPGQTLQATALVHEAYLRVQSGEPQQWSNRGHFFAAAAEAMRRILVENARRKLRPRHGGDLRRVDVEALEIDTGEDHEKVLLVHESLDRLAGEDPVKAEVVKLKFFVGLSNAETAQALGLSEKTVNRHWRYARAWLWEDIRGKPPE